MTPIASISGAGAPLIASGTLSGADAFTGGLR